MLRNGWFILMIAIVAAAACDAAGAAPVVRPRQPLDGAEAHQRLEWDVALDRAYDNPFDPDLIAVDAEFAGPGGRKLVLPAFWMGTKDPGFAVRFAAPEAGRWTMTVVAKDKADTRRSEPVTFEVAESWSDGFVRRAPGNPRYFQFDSGRPFFILGLNIAWAGKQGLGAFERWFGALSASGGNFARVWMSHPNLMTETVEAGIGRYDQEACAFYDGVFDLAQRKGVYCMVTFNNYRDLRDRDNWGPAIWPQFPYNAANGGPLERPAQFFTHPEALRLYRQRLRYIVGRYSAYTSVAFWEFWNEQSFTEVTIRPEWTRDMARYLRATDPYQHLITTSFGHDAQPEVWEMPEIDLTQSHLYPGELCDDSSVPISTSSYTHRSFDKPHLVGEFGVGAMGSDAKSDPKGTGTNMHNGVWSSMLSGGAGGAAVWWWDNYVDPKDLWHVYAGPAAFAREIDWPRRKFEPLRVPAPTIASGSDAETFADLAITAAGVWGRSHGEVIEILPNGQATRGLPTYLYGPDKPQLRTPTVVRVDLPRDSTMVVRIDKVSDHGTLRVSIDGQPTRDFFFSALPGAEGQAKTEKNSPRGYQGTFGKDCSIPVPAGKHTVALEVIGGDWLTVQSLRFTGAKSSRLADLHVLALQDAGNGETIAWLRDPASNWQNDLKGVELRTIAGANVKFPVTADGPHEVQWWDTRSGRVVNRSRATPADGKLSLDVPPVVRDVALRVVPARGASAATAGGASAQTAGATTAPAMTSAATTGPATTRAAASGE